MAMAAGSSYRDAKGVSCVVPPLASPTWLAGNIRVLDRQFRVGRQEDAHEFLRRLLEHCGRSSGRQRRAAPVGESVGSIYGGSFRNQCVWGGAVCAALCVRRVPPCMARASLRALPAACYALCRPAVLLCVRVVCVRACRQSCRLRAHRAPLPAHCVSCGHDSISYEAFMDMSLVLGSGGGRAVGSVSHALANFAAVDTLDGANTWCCPACDLSVRAPKQITIRLPPAELTLQLKRFTSGGNKVLAHVAFEEALDLSPALSPEALAEGVSARYTLHGVLVHHGDSADSGHYSAYNRAANGQWYLADDGQVTRVDWGVVAQQMAYILFYSRTPGQLAPRDGPAAHVAEAQQGAEPEEKDSDRGFKRCEYSHLPVAVLKKRCRAAFVSASGSKDTLIQRLRKQDREGKELEARKVEGQPGKRRRVRK